MNRRGPWEILGLTPEADRRAVRKAYARRLKSIDQETEPEEFEALRRAYISCKSAVESPEREDPGPLIETSWERPSREPEREEMLSHEGEIQHDPLDLRKPSPEKEGDSDPPPAEPETFAGTVAVGELLARLAKAHESSELRAVETFDEIMADPRVHVLTVHQQLEERLVGWLARLDPFPMRLLDRIAETFEWRSHSLYLARVGRGDGEKLTRQLRRLDIEAELRQRAARGEVGAKILLGHIPRWRHPFHLLSRESYQQVKRELDRLASIAPDLAERQLDGEIVRWWQRKIERPRIFLGGWLAVLLVAAIGVMPFLRRLELPHSSVPLEPLRWAVALGLTYFLAIQLLRGLNFLRESPDLGERLEELAWPAFCVAWILMMPFSTLFLVMCLQACVVFFYAMEKMEEPGIIVRWGAFSVLTVPSFVYCANSVPYHFAPLGSPALTLLILFASGSGRKYDLPSWVRWGWLPVAASILLVAWLRGDSQPALTFCLFLASLWGLLAGQWAGAWLLWPMVPLLGPVLLLDSPTPQDRLIILSLALSAMLLQQGLARAFALARSLTSRPSPA